MGAEPCKSMDSLPENNLQQHLAWNSTKPQSVMEHGLNSHVINSYLESRSTIQNSSLQKIIESKNILNNICRGTEALKAIEKFTNKFPINGKLTVVPISNETHRLPLRDISLMEVKHNESSQSNSSGINSNNNTLNISNTSTNATQHIPHKISPSIFVDDALFDDVDVDSIVARHRDTSLQNESNSNFSSKAIHESSTSSNIKTIEYGNAKHFQQTISNEITQNRTRSNLENLTNISNEMTQNRASNNIETTSNIQELDRLIKETREKLRAVREACDDASFSLEGPVPQHLLNERNGLESKLKALSIQFRKSKALEAKPCGNVEASNIPIRSPIQQRQQAQVDDHYVEADQQQKFSQKYVESTDPLVRSKMVHAKWVLREIFGHNSYRPNQEHIVQQALSSKDIFVLMPTGGGKSLCYQLPACVDDGVTVVISPLVSLIQDQVQQLQAIDVAVANLNGDQDYGTIQKPIISELFSSDITIKLLYVTPEKISSSNTLHKIFESLEKRGLLARFVIDEAHCISQWGHDFRKDYMELGQLRLKFPNVPIMALTATANTQTKNDIIKNLHLSSPFITRSSFNRPNLTYDIRRKTNKFMNEIANFVAKHIEDSGIIYCLSKKDCEQTTEKLIAALGFENSSERNLISFYHAGLEPEERALRHHEWSKGKIKLIVATVAFGMGINKPDVRYVIHHTIPQSVTHYYQEAGRAGRDGELATCILYYSFKDLSRRRKLISSDQENIHHQGVHFQNLRRMIEFCENQIECRRTSLLEYFGENFSSTNCHATCDNCRMRAKGRIAKEIDVTEDCIALLKMVQSTQDMQDLLTLVQISQLYLGQVAKNKENKSEKYERLAGFGDGKGRFERSEIERIIYHMILRQFLKEVDKKNVMGFTNTFLCVGPKSRNLFRGERVKIICKTRYAIPIVNEQANEKVSETKKSKKGKGGKSKKKKLDKNVEAPSRKIEEIEIIDDTISNDFDDIIDIFDSPTPPRTSDYPLIPKSSTNGRIPKEHVESLAALLKDWRASVCDSFNLMPYHILPTAGIAAIASSVPVTEHELVQIEGVGRIRVKKYGDAIIDIVKTYLSKHKLTPSPTQNQVPSNNSDEDNNNISTEIPPQAAKSTQQSEIEVLCLDDIDWDDVDAAILDSSSPHNKRRRMV